MTKTTKNYKMVQETIKLQFGTYTGEAKDGKPNGHGSVVFNSEDIQVIKLFLGGRLTCNTNMIPCLRAQI